MFITRIRTETSSFVLAVLVGASLSALTSCKPARPTLPAASGPCPTFVNGIVPFTVNGSAYNVRLHFDETAVQAEDGPLVLSYGLSAERALSASGLERIKAAGGIVAEPMTWTGDNRLIADQIVACAAAGPGIDPRHIHAVGHSYYPGAAFGAAIARQLGFERSSYIASIATVDADEGTIGAYQDPDNKLPVLLVYDWAAHPEADLYLAPGNVRYERALQAAGHYALLCGGVTSTSATPLVAQFLFDHAYRASPEPYAGGLPAEFATYCPPPWKPYVSGAE